ncbi:MULTISPECIES: hypothetical protein [Sphingobium]|uniref:C-type lysozyme inhibitor domain-containing protein n=2 Tax=Sphingobium TaxID=165695 RepID=A0A7M2GN62_SPHSA|nr:MULTISPECIES: hypothetical protein [Sphingobium]AJR23795.1 hypothetical protein TZ53_08745 [Sphingobium sp. YBL2]QOT73667.1 hypothetical protein H5V43_20935 [Sphingobium fuliginis]
MTCRSFPGALMPMAAIVAAAATLAPAGAQRPDADMEVQCAAGRRFSVRADADRATVVWKDGQLTLKRGAISLGRYYRSPRAALIIDGDYVSFVPRGDRNWRDCRLMPRTDVIEKD